MSITALLHRPRKRATETDPKPAETLTERQRDRALKRAIRAFIAGR